MGSVWIDKDCEGNKKEIKRYKIKYRLNRKGEKKANMAETRVTIAKLNSNNYESWRYKIELLLIKEGPWDVINKAAPEQPDTTWQTKDAQARATIGFLIEGNHLIHIRNKTTAAATWKALQDYHQKVSLSNKVMSLKSLCSTKLTENGNIEEHIIGISIIKERLEAIGEEIKEDYLLQCYLIAFQIHTTV